MGKPKKVATKAAPKKSAAKKAASSFVKGQRVKVLSGDWGQSRGTVAESLTVDGYVLVTLDNAPRKGAMEFAPSNLIALNPVPVRR